MKEIKLAGGSDLEVIVWVVVMIIWGVSRLISKLASSVKASAPASAGGGRKAKRQAIEELMEAMRGMVPAAHPIPTAPPPPRIMELTPVEPPRKTATRKGVPPLSGLSGMDQDYNDTMHGISDTGSVLGAVTNVFKSAGATLNFPSDPLAMPGEHAALVSPFRPAWNTRREVGRALVASLILGRSPDSASYPRRSC